MNKYFDKIVCVNLIERADKKEASLQKFNKYNINVEWYNPVIFGFNNIISSSIINNKNCVFNKNMPNEIGCAISHYHVIKQAYLEGCERIFIFEDDFLLMQDFNNKFDKYMNDIPKNWDMFMLYSYIAFRNEFNTDVSKLWLKARGCWSTLAYALNRKSMKYYIDYQDSNFSVSDKPLYSMQENDEYNCYFNKIPLIIPSKSDSDIRTIKNYELQKSFICKYTNDKLYE